MAGVEELGFLPFAFAREPRVGIRCGRMGGVAAALAVEIHRRIARVIGRRRRRVLPFEAFEAGPRLHQCSVHGEVLVGEQAPLPGLGHHPIKEPPGDLPGEQPLSVLGEHCRIPDGVIHLQAHEPAKQQVVVELLHQQALAPDRVQHLQQQGAQQLLGRNRRATHPRVELAKARRELSEYAVNHRPHHPQRMLGRNTLLHRHVTPHRAHLIPIIAAHAHLPGSRHAHRSRTFMLTRYLKSGFSAAC